MDLLNHYPCLSLVERVSPAANRFFRETVEQYTKEVGVLKVSDYLTDLYLSELGVRDQVLGVQKLSDITLWRDYCIASELIQSAVRTRHPSQTKCANLINWILMSPSVDIDDIKKIYQTLNQIPDIVDVRREKDFYKEIMGTVFDKVLPYKLHAYGLTEKMSALVTVDEEQQITSHSYNYLELLIRVFMTTLQGMRGRNLSDLKQDMKVLTVCIYLFMNTVFLDATWSTNDLRVFETYIDVMMQFGIGTHIVERVTSIQMNSHDWFSLIDGVSFDNPAIQQMVHTVSMRKKKFHQSNTLLSNDHALNTEWNGWLLMGNGSFGQLAEDPDQLDEFCYAIEALRSGGIQECMDIPSTVSFQISESDMGYLLSDMKADVCKIYYPAEDRAVQTIVKLQGKQAFLLFRIPETNRVYGVSLFPSAKGGRVLLQLGTDQDEFVYRLVDPKE